MYYCTHIYIQRTKKCFGTTNLHLCKGKKYSKTVIQTICSIPKRFCLILKNMIAVTL